MTKLDWRGRLRELAWYLKRKKTLTAGILITVFCLCLVLIGAIHPPYDIEAMEVTNKFAPASLAHLLGTDQFGRDVFSRVLKGAETTLIIALGTVGIGLLGGLFIGGISGYFGGLLDELLMRVNDTLFAFPSVLLALVIVSLFGSGTRNVIWALGIAFIPSFARMVRSEFMRYRDSDYIAAARLYGTPNLRIMVHHILPNTVPVLLSSVMIGFNNAVLAEAGLSYLGIGVQPPQPSLGRMLSEAQSFLMTAPLAALGPGVMIILLVLGFSMVGEGITGKESA